MPNNKTSNTKKKTKLGKGSASAGANSAKPLLVGLTAFVVAAIGVVALLTTLGGAGGSNGSFTPNDQGLLQPGAQAPQITADSATGGGRVSVPSSGGPTLLVFFATWCPHCNNEAPILSDLAEQNKDLNVVMAGMDGRDNPEKVQQFVEKYGIQGQAFYKPSTGQTYQVTGYPTTYVIDGSGKIVRANSGETPENVLQDWIDQAA